MISRSGFADHAGGPVSDRATVKLTKVTQLINVMTCIFIICEMTKKFRELLVFSLPRDWQFRGMNSGDQEEGVNGWERRISGPTGQKTSP